MPTAKIWGPRLRRKTIWPDGKEHHQAFNNKTLSSPFCFKTSRCHSRLPNAILREALPWATDLTLISLQLLPYSRPSHPDTVLFLFPGIAMYSATVHHVCRHQSFVSRDHQAWSSRAKDGAWSNLGGPLVRTTKARLGKIRNRQSLQSLMLVEFREQKRWAESQKILGEGISFQLDMCGFVHACSQVYWGWDHMGFRKIIFDQADYGHTQKNKKEGIHLQLVLAAGRTLSIALLTSYTLAFITTIICVICMCWYGGPDNP